MTLKTQTMKKFGLIGYPIGSSMSPALFKAGYKGKYDYDLIEEADFDTAYEKFMAGYAGINVTAPFKLQAFSRADKKSEMCRKIGAANLLIKSEDGSVNAFNTDFDGVSLSILEAILPDRGLDYFYLYGSDFSSVKTMLPTIYGHRPKAMIAGCGGAGRAAAAAAAALGYDTVLVNRSPEKAAKIADEMPEYHFRSAGIEHFPEMLAEADLLVYTIPERICGLEKLDRSMFASPGKIILEANYRQPSFKAADISMINGCKGTYVSGLRWLLYQALVGFKIFTGENPDFDRMCEVL